MLNTEKLENIIEKFGGDTSKLDTNLESERLDMLMNMEGGGSGGSGKYKPRFILFSGYTGSELNEELANLDTSLITSMNQMFKGCSSVNNLNLSNFNTNNVTDMGSMFYSCNNIVNLDLNNFNTSKVTNMGSMFGYCKYLKNLDLKNFDTSEVTRTDSMFYGCERLVSLNLSNLDFTKLTRITDMFRNCTGLTDLEFGINCGKSFTYKSGDYNYYRLNLSTCTSLTHDSLMSVINNLYDLNLTYDVANGGTLYTQSLVLGATNLAKLTEEEIAIATNKGWIVS